MSRRHIVILSLGANLLLVVAVWHLSRARRATAPPERVTCVTNIVVRPAAQPIATGEVAHTETFTAPARFDWSRFEAEDFRVVVANLRAVGCPESTIRDIVLPDLIRLYEQRRGAVLVAVDFWASGPVRAAANRERERRIDAITDEQQVLMGELFGVDWPISGDHRGNGWGDGALTYLLSDSLTMETTREFARTLERYEGLSNRLREETRGILLPEDERRVEEIKRGLKRDVAALMSEVDLAELKLRVAAMDQFSDLEDFKDSPLTFSPGEMRQLVQLRAGDSDALTREFHWALTERTSEAEARKWMEDRAAAEKIRELLGDRRYEQYLDVTDDDWKSARDFAAEHKLAASSGRAIYEICKANEDRLSEIGFNAEWSRREKRLAREEALAATAAALLEAMGQSAFDEYRKSHAQWLNQTPDSPGK